MKLKGIDKLFGKTILCFSVKTNDDVNYSGKLHCGNLIISIEPVYNSNMLDLDNAIFELKNGTVTQEFIGQTFYE